MCRSIASNAMSILDNLKLHESRQWKVKSVDTLKKEDFADYEGVSLATGDYGLSVCLTLRGGQRRFLPLSRDSKLITSVSFDTLAGAEVITLEKPGEEDIYRIKF